MAAPEPIQGRPVQFIIYHYPSHVLGDPFIALGWNPSPIQTAVNGELNASRQPVIVRQRGKVCVGGYAKVHSAGSRE